MRPSSLLALPLLVATFVSAITNAEEYTAAAPVSSPPETSLPPPPPPTPSHSSPPPPAVNPPAWSSVTNVNDRTIQQVGWFAVHAYFFNTGEQLVFMNVVSGNSYRLVITVASTGGKMAQYSVSVWSILGTTTWQLWSFAPN